ncbi:MAG: UMP kinase [Bacilli bacterium]|nr:UMP kinase [Bacilli bacterium]
MYKRVLLKLSGEALKDENAMQILNVDCVKEMALMMKALHDEGVQVAVVIGAGNIWRGNLASGIGIERAPADYMGMMGTVMNAVCMSSALKEINIPSVVFSALPEISGLTVTYSPEEAIKAMENGNIVFLAGGTGKPFFTTDTAATLRAIETKCDVIFMGKNGVKGVYDKDPTKYVDAKFIPEITYNQIIEKKLQIMDLSAVELIKDQDIEIRVFSMSDPENFIKVAKGENLGTTCKRGE